MLKPFYMFSSVIAVGFSFLLGWGSACNGAIITWDDGGANTDFLTGANWDPDGAPGAGDDVEILGNVLVTATAANLLLELKSLEIGEAGILDSPTFSVANLTLKETKAKFYGATLLTAVNLTLGDGAKESKIELFDSAQIDLTGNLYLGLTNKGKLKQKDAGSVVNVTQSLYIGKSGVKKTERSEYSVEEGTLEVGGSINVEKKSKLKQSGGDISVGLNLALNGDGAEFDQAAGNLSVSGGISLSDKAKATSNGVVNVGKGLTLDNSTWKNSGVSSNMSVAMSLQILNGSKYTLEKDARLSVGGLIDTMGGDFDWKSGGTLEAYTLGGVIDVDGDLTASAGAILNLNHKDEYLDVSGTFTADGLIIDGYDLMFEDLRQPSSVAESHYVLISADVFGASPDITFNFSGFDGAVNQAGASPYAEYITVSGDDVYWFQMDGGELSVHWHLQPIPEPHSSLLLALGSGALLLRRRR